MRDLQYLCEVVGIEPVAFYFDKDDAGYPVLRSDFTMIRRINPCIIEHEDEILAEALSLYKNGIMQLAEEADLILRFLESNYEKGIDLAADF